MRYGSCLILVFFALVVGRDDALAESDPCARIISLAPSVTETAFALGLGDKVVGVSRFCEYPLAVKALPRVGGFLDPNYEAIVKLKPSVVMYLSEFRDGAQELHKLGLETLILEQRRVTEIVDSLRVMGRFCGIEKRAEEMASSLEQKLTEARQRTAGLKKVRTLVVVGSEEVESIKNLYVSGGDGFYDELVKAAGGENVVTGETKTVTALSLESVLKLNPEVIIEIHPDIKDTAAGSRAALQAWGAFPMIPAVKNKQVFVIGADYSYIPGPRFHELLNVILSIIHPEVQIRSDATS